MGQEEQSLSTAPALGGDTIVAHSAVLRAFLVAESDGFVWMDGGLTRTADHPDRVTMSAGGTSKDTWVVAPPSEHSWVPTWVALPQVDLRDSVTASSAASMFWIGRNLERAETIIRLVRSIDEALGLWPELRDEADGAWVDAMGAAVVALMHEEAEPDPASHPRLDAASVRALGDPELSRSLTTSLRYLVRGGRSVRERLSTDAWRMLSELELLQPRLDGASPVEARELAEATIAPLSALSGLVMESMVRDPGWRFLDLGRRIERSELLCTLLRAALVPPSADAVAAPLHESVLAAWDCLGAYRRRHRSDIERGAMFALLIEDGGNPRSLRFQVDRMSEDVADLPAAERSGAVLDDDVAALGALLRSTSAADMAVVDSDGRLTALDELVDAVLRSVDRLADQAELGYFARSAPAPWSVTTAGPDDEVPGGAHHPLPVLQPCEPLLQPAPPRPPRDLTQRVLHSELQIEPTPDDRSRRLDEHGNEVEYVTIERPHDGRAATSICELQVEPYDISPAAHRSWEATRDAVIGPDT